MTERYVDGANGNNSWDGLSPVFTSGSNGPKATLNGAEDTPVVASDLVHVRPGTYRELLTVDVSGTSGNAIEYRGDYAGLIWPSSAGQVVRVTGSDNDQTATRANCVSANAKNYRTFTGIRFDLCTSHIISSVTSGTGWIIDKCSFNNAVNANCVRADGTAAGWTIQNCLFFPHGGSSGLGIGFTNGTTVNDTGHVVQNCVFVGGISALNSSRIGGITVKNCVCIGHRGTAISATPALAVGQVLTVNNCILTGNSGALSATTTAEFVEDYNSLSGNNTDRTNVTAGANSNTFPPLLDVRWFFQLVTEGAGPNHASQIITPFDLASFSQLLNVAGTSPTTTDMRGTAVQGAQREWGALEHDATLKIEGGSAGGLIVNRGMMGGVNG